MADSFLFEGIELPLNTKVTPFVPKEDIFDIGAVDTENIKNIMGCIKENMPVLLEGPTGVGKTASIKWLAKCTNNSYRRLQINGQTTVESFNGRWLLNKEGTYWVYGVLADCMRNGYWLLLDELNMSAGDVTALLHIIMDDDACLVLDDKDQEIIEKHPDFRLFAAINPTDEYAGTKEVNKALMDRFQKVNFNYLDEATEIRILTKKTGISPDFGTDGGVKDPLLKRMVRFANIIRDANNSGVIMFTCSTRQLISWARLAKTLGIKQAAKVSILNKCSEAEREDAKLDTSLDAFFRENETFEYHKEKDKLHKKVAPLIEGTEKLLADLKSSKKSEEAAPYVDFGKGVWGVTTPTTATKKEKTKKLVKEEMEKAYEVLKEAVIHKEYGVYSAKPELLEPVIIPKIDTAIV